MKVILIEKCIDCPHIRIELPKGIVCNKSHKFLCKTLQDLFIIMPNWCPLTDYEG